MNKNSIAKANLSDANDKIQLHVGDTCLEYSVTSQNGKETLCYHITFRKGIILYLLEKLGDRASCPDLTLNCSVCKCVLFRPRISADSCRHLFCNDCLSLILAGSDSTSPECLFCHAECINKSDHVKETKISDIDLTCPFSSFGCAAGKLKWGLVGTHIQSCEFVPERCTECGVYDKRSMLTNGVHTTHCVKSCEKCNRKISTTDPNFHETHCAVSNQEIKDKAHVPDIQPWEKVWVNRSKIKSGAVTKAADLIQEYLASLKFNWRKSIDNDGHGDIYPSVTALNESAEAFATAIDMDIEQFKVKGGLLNDELHLQLGHVLKEMYLCNLWFPPKKEKNAQTDENQIASDSFMADEVKGLLLQLGVPPSSTFAVQLQALESEYHRLKNDGQTNEAAEVQGLITWKMKDAPIIEGLGKGQKQKREISNTDFLAQAVHKYQDAVRLDPFNYEAQ